jgi:NADPH:quinone reductase-like Zn-dependent oxidoreductase
MRALHLPAMPDGESNAPFSFPDKIPTASALQFSKTDFPLPQLPAGHGIDSDPTYHIRVLTTALTRGELGWGETLAPDRWGLSGGAIPGHDVVGVIEEDHGISGAALEPGTKVWGLIAFSRDGAAADVTLGRASELARVPLPPAGVDERAWDEQLATIPLSGLSAWQALFVHGGLTVPEKEVANAGLDSGKKVLKKVLVTGAVGTVGNLAVQLAKAVGCHVVAVCGERNAGFVKGELGADEVIKYDGVGFKGLGDEMRERCVSGVDVVVDTTGGEMLRDILVREGVVKNDGVVVSVAHPLVVFGRESKGEIEQRLLRRGLHFCFFIVEPNGQQFERIGELVEIERVRGFVESVYDLENGQEAADRVEMRGAVRRGKVVLRVV